jgi:general secretion pathway protein B
MAVAKAAPAAPVEAVRPASNVVPQFSDLPETLRRQIPALHISGAVYSDSPSEWTLIINDQVMSRGSLVAPDVRLEEVTASSATFNFKGQRFRMDR